jgi:hypothetical protein
VQREACQSPELANKAPKRVHLYRRRWHVPQESPEPKRHLRCPDLLNNSIHWLHGNCCWESWGSSSSSESPFTMKRPIRRANAFRSGWRRQYKYQASTRRICPQTFDTAPYIRSQLLVLTKRKIFFHRTNSNSFFRHEGGPPKYLPLYLIYI